MNIKENLKCVETEAAEKATAACERGGVAGAGRGG